MGGKRKRGFVMAAVIRAVCLQEWPLRELPLYFLPIGAAPWYVTTTKPATLQAIAVHLGPTI